MGNSLDARQELAGLGRTSGSTLLGLSRQGKAGRERVQGGAGISHLLELLDFEGVIQEALARLLLSHLDSQPASNIRPRQLSESRKQARHLRPSREQGAVTGSANLS